MRVHWFHTNMTLAFLERQRRYCSILEVLTVAVAKLRKSKLIDLKFDAAPSSVGTMKGLSPISSKVSFAVNHFVGTNELREDRSPEVIDKSRFLRFFII